MTAVAAIIITDGTTPLTLSPISSERGEVFYRANDNTVPKFSSTLLSLFRKPKAPVKTYLQRHTFRQPVIRVVDGVDTVVGHNHGELVLRMLAESSESERTSFYEYVRNLAAKGYIKDQTIELIPPL